MPANLKELKEKLEAYAARARPLVEFCRNEEQTKTTLVNPYLELLGYEVRDPRQVQLEYSADIGGGREKVDYAILRDGRPWLLIEAKTATRTLDGPLPAQLARYALAGDADFMLYTNGVIYQWYEKPKSGAAAVDGPPFLTHNALEPGDRELEWLSRIDPRHSEQGDLARIAEEERLQSVFKAWFDRASVDPPDNFLSLLLNQAGWRSTENSRERARRVWLRAMRQSQQEILNRSIERLRSVDAEIEPPAARESEVPAAQEVPAQGNTRTFETANGPVELDPSKLPRAWRPKGAPVWKICPSGRETAIEIVGWLASQHDAGTSDFYETLCRNGLMDRNDERRGSVQVDRDGAYFLRTHMSNEQRIEYLGRIARLAVRGGVAMDLDRDVETWLETAQWRRG